MLAGFLATCFSPPGIVRGRPVLSGKPRSVATMHVHRVPHTVHQITRKIGTPKFAYMQF